MRHLIVIVISLFLIGCSGKKSQYLLPNSTIGSVKSIKTQIGVKKIELPSYLKNDKIVIKEGLQIKRLNANFVTSADELFTNRAIKDFKKALNNPNVFLYPWDVDKKKGYIITIVIDEFIYEDSKIHLSGSYYIKSSSEKVLNSSNFDMYRVSSKEIDNILQNMSTLFDELIEQIAKKIAK